jgi:hypothetical protein
MTSLLLGVK